MSSDVDDALAPIRMALRWVHSGMKRLGSEQRGGIGAAWDVADGVASMLYAYRGICIAAQNHAAAEGADYP